MKKKFYFTFSFCLLLSLQKINAQATTKHTIVTANKNYNKAGAVKRLAIGASSLFLIMAEFGLPMKTLTHGIMVMAAASGFCLTTNLHLVLLMVLRKRVA